VGELMKVEVEPVWWW